MTLLPRSLYGRLLVTALVATLAALAFAAVTIGAVLDRFVMHGLDDRLDAQIAVLEQAVRPNGTIDRARLVLAAPYDDPQGGWGWRIDAPGRTITSPAAPELAALQPRGPRFPPPPASPPVPSPAASAASPPVAPPPPPMPDAPRAPHGVGDGPLDRPLDRNGDRAQALDWYGHDGMRHARSLTLATPAGPVRITAAAPRAIVDRPLRAAMAPLLGALLLLGLALGAATLVQLRIGLRPLKTMRTGLAAIRAGTARTLPEDQPTELAPLAHEINALLAENAAALANARGHVANLAHGLKTPLATLALALPAHDPDGTLAAQVARIDQAVRHHLGRARAATPGSGLRFATPLAPVVADLTTALSRIHAERGVTASATIAPALSVAVDRQDLDELIGNLLDNAWRFATTRIAVTAAAAPDPRFIRLSIADDGPGIAPEARTSALAAGQRLDERGDGHGFGLSIAYELATLYGGTLVLEAATLGGLDAIVTLPAALFAEA
ncbi:ATP-binding protein [Sphingomonas glacialis]|uniref:histidine kinase n=1 Tax=Sphingomonas glacialis TaxID=658225 RepID=A0A502FK97_9SPHN|nr:sensor histidine kinase [Sphingomonas glacialis]TPG49814.1 sensor histidine kinase [Sphingomonas glacialis]